MTEGLTPRYNYTNEQWYYIRQVQKYLLALPFDGKARNVEITKMFDKPLQAMAARMNEIIKGNEANRDSMRYMIYSFHDTQIINILEWLDLLDEFYLDAPYASTIYFELRYDSECIAKNPSTDCFTVHMRYNGDPLKLDTCIDNNLGKGSKS
jgi:hypothetical protein